MNRVDFLESVSGIKYPQMMVDFFDHFLALKLIIEDSGKINVINYNSANIISFSVIFKSPEYKKLAIDTINSKGGVIFIYGRQITISVDDLADSELQIILK